MTRTTPEQNKALVLETIDTLFNKRDNEAATLARGERGLHQCANEVAVTLCNPYRTDSSDVQTTVSDLFIKPPG
jgi:hypothetical protein